MRIPTDAMMIAPLILVASLNPLQVFADEPSLILNSKCVSENCVEMMLNWGSDRPNYTTIEQSNSGFTTFAFNVKGRLNGEATSIHEVHYKGYTDGLYCSDFGQGNAAVLGISNGEPTLETSGGSLEIVDSSLTVGCSECFQLMNSTTKKVVKRYTSPSWDLSLAGIRFDHVHELISYDSEDRVFLMKRSGVCLKLSDDGLISKTNAENCQEMEELEWPIDELSEGPRRIFRRESLDNFLVIYQGACT